MGCTGASTVLAWCWNGAIFLSKMRVVVLQEVVYKYVAFSIPFVAINEALATIRKIIKHLFKINFLEFEGERFRFNLVRAVF